MDISIDAIRKTTEELSKYENRIAGTQMEHAAADYLIKRFEEYGFDEILQHKFPVISWNPQEATLKVVRPEKISLDCVLLPCTTNFKGRVRLVGMDSEDVLKTDKFPIFGLIDWEPVVGASTVAYNLALESGLNGLIISSPDEGDMFKVLIVDRGGDLQIPVFNVTKEEGDSLKKMLIKSEVIVDVIAVAEKVKSESCNIEALIPGTDDDYEIVIGAHYDAWFSGAADNAAPVAIALELARILRKHVDDGGSLKHTVRFLLFGAEECGSERFYFWVNGSRVYVESQKSLENFGLVLNLDCVGYHSTNYVVTTLELSEFAMSIVKTLEQEDRFVHEVPPGSGSDHWFFTTGGVPTIYLISWPSKLYHTQKDIPEFLDYESIKAFAEYAIKVIIDFSNSDILPFDVMNQMEAIRERINNFITIKVPATSLQPVLDVLNNILSYRMTLSEFMEEIAKLGNQEKTHKLNSFLRNTAGTINKTIGLFLSMKGESPAVHLPFLELFNEYAALETAIEAIERLPIMKLTPRTRSRLKSFYDTPMKGVEGDRAFSDLRKEREKLINRIQKEIAVTLDIVSRILEDLVTLLK